MKNILLFILCCMYASSQGQSQVRLTMTNNNHKQLKKNIQTNFKDSTSLVKYLNELRQFAIRKGYLLASIDTLQKIDNQYSCVFFIGQQFKQAQLLIQEKDMQFVKKNAHLSEKLLAKIPFQPQEISRIMRSVQASFENNGYPFSSVYLKEININESSLNAELNIQRGKEYRFTELHVKGDSSISKVFISSLLDIHEGDLFKEEKLQAISQKIKQISFLKEIKQHELLFTEKGVELFLYIQSNPLSSINGAVGLQPNQTTNKIGLTGELNLKLLNLLKRGELVNLNWRSIQPQTQSLNANLNYPFLFKTAFGIDGQFQLYKRDTTFLELKTTAGVQYFLSGGSYLKLFYQNTSSNLLKGSDNNPNFSNLSTVRGNAYGIALNRRQIDYLPNPTKGFIFFFEIAVGTRKTRQNDTLDWQRSTTYRSALQIEYFIPLTRRNVIRLANRTETYYAPMVFQNEVFRFGGLQSLRGFNEEELYGTTRSVMSVEYRFLVDKNSHVFAFYDQGWYENNSIAYYNDLPFGFGVGFSFGTNLGIFSISYALGKQFDNAVTFRSGKVHFGYIAYF